MVSTPPVDVVTEDLVSICERIGSSLSALSGKTILVAGGSGFLGSYFLDTIIHANDHILTEPCQILCVDNFKSGPPERLLHLQDRADFRLLEQDLSQPLTITESVDYIVHTASLASPSLYRQFPLQTIDVNVFGTRSLLDIALQHKAKSFVYLSSSEIYGDPDSDSIPTPETYRGNVSSTGPRACYDESKRLAETLCMTYYRQYDLPVKIIRPFNVYGPRLGLNDGRVMPDFLKDALDGRPITLLSDGNATRSFCYVSDAITACFLLLLSDANGEAFNVGNPDEITIRQLAQQIESMFDNNPGLDSATSDDPDYLTDNPIRRCPDLTKIKETISWESTVNLEAGLQKTIQWHLSQQSPQ